MQLCLHEGSDVAPHAVLLHCNPRNHTQPLLVWTMTAENMRHNNSASFSIVSIRPGTSLPLPLGYSCGTPRPTPLSLTYLLPLLTG